jgi:glucose-6-phosphate isomerase
MYRDVHLPEHEELIRKNNLRYDITVVPPIMLGEEFNKTVGHYHPLVPGQKLAYPELYEVLEGEGLFMIQKVDQTGKDIEDIQAIKAQVGDKVLYPSGYGHIIINIGKGPLVTANWSANNFESIYQPVKDMAGMGYYVVSDGNGKFRFLPNSKYEFLPPIKYSDTAESGWGVSKEEPMYITGVSKPQNLEFLNNPEILTKS